MGQQQTSVAERNHFVDLKLQGHTLREIAEATGWSFECVRSWWRRYRDGGRSALDPEDGRKQRGGRMSSFSAEMRAAFSEMKENHPRWGAPVARTRIGQQMDVDEAQLPSVSTIEKYWAESHPELFRSHRPQRPKPAPEPVPDITAPHERWQMDFKEWMAVESVGYIDVLSIRDEATPVKIGSFVYPARKSTGRDIQEALRGLSPAGVCVTGSRPTGISGWSATIMTIPSPPWSFSGLPDWVSCMTSLPRRQRMAVSNASTAPGLIAFSQVVTSRRCRRSRQPAMRSSTG